MVDLQRYRATSGERNFIERIKAPIFLQAVLVIEIMLSLPQLSFPSIEINKPLPAPVHSQCLLDQTQVQKPILVVATDQMPDHTQNRDNIIKKVINVQQKKCRTMNGALINSNINWIVWWCSQKYLLIINVSYFRIFSRNLPGSIFATHFPSQCSISISSESRSSAVKEYRSITLTSKQQLKQNKLNYFPMKFEACMVDISGKILLSIFSTIWIEWI